MTDGPAGRDPAYRFTLANERTFLAWLRTALALVAGGMAVLILCLAVTAVLGGAALTGSPHECRAG